MWKEESSGGQDNNYADYTEFSLIQGHGHSLGIGFGTPGYARPSAVRLGYKSPDNYEYAIWTFIIQCELLRDSEYKSWFPSLTGLYMPLGFKSEADICMGKCILKVGIHRRGFKMLLESDAYRDESETARQAYGQVVEHMRTPLHRNGCRGTLEDW